VAAAVTVPGAPAVVAYLDAQLIGRVVQRYLGFGRLCVLEHVGEALLDDPVGGDIDPARQGELLTGNAQPHGQPGTPELFQQSVKTVEAWLRRELDSPAVLAHGIQQVPHVRQCGTACLLDIPQHVPVLLVRIWQLVAHGADLQDHDADRVGDGVVQLSRDSASLVGRRSARGGLAVVFGVDRALFRARTTQGVRSAVALTSTTLGPSLCVSGNTLPAQILTGGQGGGLDVGITSGSLSALHGDTIALGRHVADAAGARIGDRVVIMLGDGTPAHATVVAIHSRDLAFGDALLSPELAAGHQTIPLMDEILIETNQPTAAVATRLQALAQRYPGLHVSDSASLITANDANNELNHWLGPFFVAMIFVFTSIAVLNTLIMVALRRRRELALLQLVGATTRQVRSMARWEAILIIAMGLGIGLAIAATALLPLTHALTGGFRPYVPAGWFAAILGISALLALVALSVPTRQALRSRPIEAIGVRE